ncbi:hypothetical protein BJY52DRAFT_1226036 [Lactarius psammicola]|nr:hypothetical protein BJY52DRAFT_1226036 [Lactarius psammicola]
MNFDMEDDTQWSDLCDEKWDKWTADKLREKWATLKKEVGESATHQGSISLVLQHANLVAMLRLISACAVFGMKRFKLREAITSSHSTCFLLYASPYSPILIHRKYRRELQQQEQYELNMPEGLLNESKAVVVRKRRLRMVQASNKSEWHLRHDHARRVIFHCLVNCFSFTPLSGRTLRGPSVSSEVECVPLQEEGRGGE